jgi:hypothetical protein
MDGTNQAAILILSSCGNGTDCDQEANEKKSSACVAYVSHASKTKKSISQPCEFAMNSA